MIDLIYTTLPDAAAAEKIGKALVSEKLAGCVNMIPTIRSIYWWEGRIDEGQEIALLVKTPPHLKARAMDRLRELHPYTCPCVMSWPIPDMDHRYGRWLTENCQAPSGSEAE